MNGFCNNRSSSFTEYSSYYFFVRQDSSVSSGKGSSHVFAYFDNDSASKGFLSRKIGHLIAKKSDASEVRESMAIRVPFGSQSAPKKIFLLLIYR
jgi:hypothetical protein